MHLPPHKLGSGRADNAGADSGIELSGNNLVSQEIIIQLAVNQFRPVYFCKSSPLDFYRTLNLNLIAVI